MGFGAALLDSFEAETEYFKYLSRFGRVSTSIHEFNSKLQNFKHNYFEILEHNS